MNKKFFISIIMVSAIVLNISSTAYVNASVEGTTFDSSSVTQENDISFPLTEYPANIYDSSIASDYTYLKPRSWFHTNGQEGCSSSNCRRYSGTNECEGFARYAHDVYMHMVDESISYSSWLSSKHNGGRYEFSDTKDVIEFFSDLNTGAYIRYGKNSDSTPSNGVHSVVFVSADDTGVWVYECNQNYYKNLSSSEIGSHNENYFGCGVFFHYLSYDNILERYNYVLHYVNHTFSTANVYEDTTYHRVNCTDCDGYLLQKHTGSVTYDTSSSTHVVGYDCCAGGVSHDADATEDPMLYSVSQHRINFDCCEGYELINHTGQLQYMAVSATSHRVTASCCSGYITQAHSFKGTKCLLCGYDSDNPSSILSKDPESDKE